MINCGSCNNPIHIDHVINGGSGCFLCGKDCHDFCLMDPSHLDYSLPGLKEALNIQRGWVCFACVLKAELQIINTLPLQTLPKYLNYSFSNDEGRARLLERMAQ